VRRPNGPLSEKRFFNLKAEEMRLRSLYRDLAMREQHGLAINALRGLVGPDCAYHLYRNIGDGPERPGKE
jgi:hypothetical protein